MTAEKEHLGWIDNTKVFACVLVALGHFFQSMVSSAVIADNVLYRWFNHSIYYFHVPLFFICSGYLFQKYTTVDSYSSWLRNVKKKLLSLGIPYFVFSFITWCLKSVFSGSVNTEVDGLFYSLFIDPLSPYWYLFSLFFIFLLTPTFDRKRMSVLWLVFSFGVNILCEPNFRPIRIVSENLIWFSIGIVICVFDFPKGFARLPKWLCALLLFGFLLGSVLTWKYGLSNEIIDVAMGMLACFGIIGIAIKGNQKANFLAPYTMAIFLMHTIFAAGIRSVLFKIGIDSAWIHIPAGLVMSFAAPVVAAEIMKCIKLDFFLEPGKYIRIK